MTYGEAIAWLYAAMDRHNGQFEELKYQAWFNGVAFNRAYVASKDAQQSYPSFLEMFPKPKTEAELGKEEQASWEAEREEMAMILTANSNKSKPIM